MQSKSLLKTRSYAQLSMVAVWVGISLESNPVLMLQSLVDETIN